MNFKRAAFLTTAIIIMLSLVFSGCSGKDADQKVDNGDKGMVDQSSGQTSEKLDPVTLKIMMPIDPQAAMEDILKQAEDSMKDTVNAKIDVIFVPWSDFKDKSQVTLSSGGELDLVFDAPFFHMREMIAGGYYEPLEDLLKKYGENVLKTRPKSMWDANKFPGKDGEYRIYGIPLGNTHSMGKGYLIRKDLREKYGISSIKTAEDLKEHLYAVKQNEKNIIPMMSIRSSTTYAEHKMLFDQDTHITGIELATLGPVYYKNNDGKVYSMFEEVEPKFWDAVKEARQFYLDGIIGSDVMAVADSQKMVEQGKSAYMPCNTFVPNRAARENIKKIIPDAELEVVTLLDTGKPYLSDFKQWNFQMIPVKSKNKERAMIFLNWANQQDNYDLLAYGIKGVHWEPVGENKYRYLTGAAKQYEYLPYLWIWNPVNDRLDADLTQEEEKLEMWLRDADNFVESKLIGFTFNPAPVESEMAQYNNLRSTYWPALTNGAVDPDKIWAEYKEKCAPYAKKIQQEFEKQIEEFIKATKK